ncbi:hypothetical protein [Phytoactinopolyspora halophila]|nr:hypothetical protein [Phytoactinopolyspora halophila]
MRATTASGREARARKGQYLRDRQAGRIGEPTRRMMYVALVEQ